MGGLVLTGVSGTNPNEPVMTGGVTSPTQYYQTGGVNGSVAGTFDTTPPASTSTNTATTGGGVVNPNAAADTAAIANTNKTLATLPGVLQAALAAANNGYASAEGGLSESEKAQRGQYDTGTTTNQQNYDSNLMAALRAGATGLGGLLSILRGTGAENWAKQAVGDTTNSDIRTGLNTRNDNQTSLDSSLSSFLTDLEQKRQENRQTLQGNTAAAQEANATQMQDLYTKLAGFYADMGDNASATAFLNKAGDLAPTVAQYATAPVSSEYASTVPVRAAPVTAFSGATQQAITAPNSTPGAGNGIFTIGDTRKRLAGAEA